ncbi:hypothetical protein Taro_044363, partial [Colocasia esculenta]|nr:hypothetical protein [Colocasia esculenta]
GSCGGALGGLGSCGSTTRSSSSSPFVCCDLHKPSSWSRAKAKDLRTRRLDRPRSQADSDKHSVAI